MAIQEKTKLRISYITSGISVILFLITPGIYIFDAGRLREKNDTLIIRVNSLELEHDTFKTEINETNTSTKIVNGKLDLLLSHFNIIAPKPEVDSTED